MAAYITVILQNLPMLFTDASLVVEWIKSLKARGVDVDSQIAAAMLDADAEVKKLLAS